MERRRFCSNFRDIRIMKRGEFIRLSILAAVGVAIAPSIKLVEKLPALKQKQVFVFKVSNELLSDKETFNVILDEHLKRIRKHGNVSSINVGYDGDDFIKNIHTVRLTIV